jgi:hypothetical protein
MNDIFSTKLLASMSGIAMLIFAVLARSMTVLRSRHPDIHHLIPRPMLLADGRNEDNSKAIRFVFTFLFRSKYLPLQDTELTWLCRLLRLLQVVLIGISGAALYIFVTNLKLMGTQSLLMVLPEIDRNIIVFIAVVTVMVLVITVLRVRRVQASAVDPDDVIKNAETW